MFGSKPRKKENMRSRKMTNPTQDSRVGKSCDDNFATRIEHNSSPGRYLWGKGEKIDRYPVVLNLSHILA
jgi:hypothetical protein